MGTNTVKVKLWNTTVGYLAWDKKNASAVFEFEQSFLTQKLDIAPLTMSIYSPHSQKGMVWIGSKDKLYHGLPPAFADSLPDKWGNLLFGAWLRDNKISTANITPIDHLSFIGSRAMGALEFEPAQKFGYDNIFSVNVKRLYDFSQQVINERDSIVLNKENSILWQDLIKISSSPGGKCPKAIIAINRQTGEVISGQGNIPEEFEHFILKYDDNASVYPYAKLEYVFYQMACAAGINIMHSELRSYGDVSHFLTCRFDRIGNERIHTQTLAAMSPESTSYEDIFAVIRRLNLPCEDSQQQFLRMCFNVIAGNVDDHSKNFAFCMQKDGQWRLSPAYDLTFSIDLAAPDYVNHHILTVNEKNKNITFADLEKTAVENDIKNYKVLIDNVINAVTQFSALAKKLDIDKKLIDKIDEKFGFRQNFYHN
ncbi:MAG: type II toxin-antitoxin system HipA family toxin [Prevotellaceae bacterium]|jgi:serine/threonine-protein kinase HipA|nr:type II toxin-antitoxin system HipA family toxin [Prevotellaceae bacterium]